MIASHARPSGPCADNAQRSRSSLGQQPWVGTIRGRPRSDHIGDRVGAQPPGDGRTTSAYVGTTVEDSGDDGSGRGYGVQQATVTTTTRLTESMTLSRSAVAARGVSTTTRVPWERAASSAVTTASGRIGASSPVAGRRGASTDRCGPYRGRTAASASPPTAPRSTVRSCQRSGHRFRDRAADQSRHPAHRHRKALCEFHCRTTSGRSRLPARWPRLRRDRR